MPDYIARKDRETGEKQPYRDHIDGVARRAIQFAEPFGLEGWAELFANAHDTGKLPERWQEKVKQNEEPPPHAPIGAALLEDLCSDREITIPLGLAVYGHHSRLHDVALLPQKIEKADPDTGAVDLESTRLDRETLSGLSPLPSDGEETAFLLRMLFSACVDADRLDAEAFTEGPRKEYPSLEVLWERFEENQKRKMDPSAGPDTIDGLRNRIYRECLDAASWDPGYFSATIPTGGGKTRSLMGFALRHALEHGLDRIVVAVPYTSIIEQNAGVYKEIFGEEAVLEHHSLAELPSKRHEKSTENWDAPIIVTTTVQLFESLYASHSSKARKAHRLGRSVIVLDEMQSLPGHVLDPCRKVLSQLCQWGEGSVVCSTATNPQFELEGANRREIISDPEALAEDMQRVRYEHLGRITHEDLAARLDSHHQGLVVCNSITDAEKVVQHVSDAYLLTTRLCPIDRRRIIDEIKAKLEAEEAVKVVSTQLIEAGVDISFPVAYRAVGPVPSIIQTAGRCNREQERDIAVVYTFELQGETIPLGSYRVGTDVTANNLQHYDLTSTFVTSSYFEDLLGRVDTDEDRVLRKSGDLKFSDAADAMELIDGGVSCAIERDETASQLLQAIEVGEVTSSQWRELQKYLITLYENDVEAALEDGLARWLGEEEMLLRWEGEYDRTRGVQL
ncbi:CRISPR-associated endonuclease Cas3'' [Salinibacter ruber]|uniref:CRISPR-associated endonuclease/helicase Cas3 n=1 Tax=Salinibacter ruber TaxID=146919 RepID=A0A9X2UNQ1_9BACT|nr:CRISPR-associated endonuclease/helicase Cas3 [Salinibacter ruber]MCS4038069.1 CRISPR-associated endonuclease/helicase Cas3 [Salinibacter ruber]